MVKSDIVKIGSFPDFSDLFAGETSYEEFPIRRVEVEQEFIRVVSKTELDPHPFPGRGDTLNRWAGRSEIASKDLCLARFAEAHVDALAILTELNGAVAAPRVEWCMGAAFTRSLCRKVDREQMVVDWRQALLLGRARVHQSVGDGREPRRISTFYRSYVARTTTTRGHVAICRYGGERQFAY
jgi:hypothetical protein